MKRRFRRLAVLAGATLLAAGAPALADKIKHPTAVFAGLDKITGRIISFEAALGETVQFGSLQITPRVCYSRPPTEAPQTDAFAEVDEVAGEPRDPPHLHRLDVRRQPRHARRRAPGLRHLADRL